MKYYIVKDGLVTTTFITNSIDSVTVDENEGTVISEEEYVESAKQKEINVRLKRDSLLSQTDWMASQDRVMSQEEKDYRQALRDITDQEGFPESVEWPTKP
jgi:hypothetical protein